MEIIIINVLHPRGTLTYVFDAHEEATLFIEHIHDLYRLPTNFIYAKIDTYDSAIVAMVEAIGPSED